MPGVVLNSINANANFDLHYQTVFRAGERTRVDCIIAWRLGDE
jgi:hypothetical protein